MIPISYYTFVESYLNNRNFLVKQGEEVTNLYRINAGVPQGSVLGPTLYLLFTYDLSVSDKVVIGTFADDTVVLAVDKNPSQASAKLQSLKA